MQTNDYATCVRRLLFVVMLVLALPLAGQADTAATVALNPPNLERGLSFMQTMAARASVREWSDRELTLQDLSDLLWIADGINRPDERKRTAPSALNAHDIDIYLFMPDGVFLYAADSHALQRILDGDFRAQIMLSPPLRPSDVMPPRPAPANPPVQIVLVSNSTRFRMGSAEQRHEWGALDAGIVSQNISLGCTALGLKTVPRAYMDKDKIRVLLSLPDTHHIFLNHPIGYAQ